MAVKFVMDEEKLKLLKKKIELHRNEPGPLMSTLHDAQDIFGCIPLEVQKVIANELGESIAKINGVVTFYSHFTLEPTGENVIAVCLGTACYVRGSQRISDEFKKILNIGANETTSDGKYTFQETRCIGACGLAPVFTVNNVVHGSSSLKDVEKVMNELRK